MLRFLIAQRGVRRNRDRVASIADRLQDLRPVGDQVLDELVEAERRHFNALPWPPLARSTRERKHRQGLPARRMHARGLMERTLTRRGPAASRAGQLTRRGKSTITFGIRRGKVAIFYARFHQKGKGVPKRIVVPAPTRITRGRIARLVLDHATRDAR